MNPPSIVLSACQSAFGTKDVIESVATRRQFVSTTSVDNLSTAVLFQLTETEIVKKLKK